MPRDHLLALDQGTSSSRAIVFHRSGRIAALAQREFRQIFPQPGWVEHDAEEIWDTQIAVAREALAKAGLQATDIAAIGITNQRETTLLWNRRTGRPVHHAIVWQDRRTEPLCAQLRATEGLAAQIRRSTGLVIDPYFSATKLRWLLDHVNGAHIAAAHGELAFGTIDSWLLWKLTGGRVHATDVSNAARTMLFDIRHNVWDHELLKALHVPDSVLPHVHPSSHVYGETEAEWFGAPIPIAGIAGDQQAALFGQACFEAGMAKNTYGTGCFLLMHTGARLRESGNGLIATAAAQTAAGAKAYALEGSVFIGGAVVQWLRDGLQAIRASGEIEALAQSVPDSGGVIVVPAFTGLGAPWWDPAARGAILGLTRDSGLAEICAATFDACALQTRDLIEAMRGDAPHAFDAGAELRVDGGMTRSAWYCQRLADLTGLPVQRASYQETTALGAALFAGLGAGIYATPREAVAVRPKTERIEPRLEVHAREAAYARWLDAIPRVR